MGDKHDFDSERIRLFSDGSTSGAERLKMLKESRVVSSYIPHCHTFVLALSDENMKTIAAGGVHSFPVGEIIKKIGEMSNDLKPDDHHKIEIDVVSHERFIEIEDMILKKNKKYEDKDKQDNKLERFIDTFAEMVYEKSKADHPDMSLDNIKDVIRKVGTEGVKNIDELFASFGKGKK